MNQAMDRTCYQDSTWSSHIQAMDNIRYTAANQPGCSLTRCTRPMAVTSCVRNKPRLKQQTKSRGTAPSEYKEDSGFFSSGSSMQSMASSCNSSMDTQLVEVMDNLHISGERTTCDKKKRTVETDCGATHLPELSSLRESLNSFVCSRQVSLEDTKARIERNKSYLKQSPDGETLLSNLIILGEKEAAFNILEDLNSCLVLGYYNKYKQTCLHLAVLQNMPELVRKLIIHGAVVASRDAAGNTPLHLACDRGFQQCVKALTEPLTHAETSGMHYSTPLQMIPQDIELSNYEGKTCLHLAAGANHLDIANHLVWTLRADINCQEGKRGKTPLHEAAETRRAFAVMFLVQKCVADPNARSYDRRSPLDLAHYRGYHDIVHLLLSAGAQMPEGSDTSDEDQMDCDTDKTTTHR